MEDVSSYVANRIREVRKSKKMTQKELAEKLGVKHNTISNYERNVSELGQNELFRISNALGISINDLYPPIANKSDIESKEVVRIPILGAIACGEPITAEENIEEYRETLKSSVPAGNLFYLKAKGDSMYPKIPDGSYVLVREQADVENGEIAAVLINGDEEATLKRIRKLGDSILLESINEDYAPYLVNEDNPARIIGKAVKLEVDL